jgi:hypothetical protein
VAKWIRKVMVEQEMLAAPWMASEVIAGGEPLWPSLP